MSEQFNIEKFRQQMQGQGPQHVPTPTRPVQAPPPMPQPQAHHTPQMQAITQPQPIARAQEMVQPHHQRQAVPYQHAQPQHVAPQQQPQQMQQPQAPMHNLDVPPVFAPPPSLQAAATSAEGVLKKSLFKLNLKRKLKAPKMPKIKVDKSIVEDEAAHTVENKVMPVTAARKISPALIFVGGMAAGIMCFLAANMALSGLLSDNTADLLEAKRIEHVQQPVLPKTVQNTNGAEKASTP